MKREDRKGQNRPGSLSIPLQEYIDLTLAAHSPFAMALRSTFFGGGTFCTRSNSASLLLLSLTFFALILAVAAQSEGNSSDPLNIYRDSDQYAYQGCFNETLEISSSSTRALSGGSFSDSDDMTVSKCLDFCAEGGDSDDGDDGDSDDGETRAYEYAGLQFAR